MFDSTSHKRFCTKSNVFYEVITMEILLKILFRFHLDMPSKSGVFSEQTFEVKLFKNKVVLCTHVTKEIMLYS